MLKIRITAVRQTVYTDLMAQYENPIEHTCDIRQGQQWISVNGKCPEGMCPAAWTSMRKFVESLAHGKGNFYDGWMQNPMSAMISCNDGFRPFSFYIEAIQEQKNAVCEAPDEQQTQQQLPTSSIDLRVQKLVTSLGRHVLTRKQIMAIMGLKEKSRKSFTDNYFKPTLSRDLIEFAYPGTPNTPVQAYRLTPEGLDLLKFLTQK